MRGSAAQGTSLCGIGRDSLTAELLTGKASGTHKDKRVGAGSKKMVTRVIVQPLKWGKRPPWGPLGGWLGKWAGQWAAACPAPLSKRRGAGVPAAPWRMSAARGAMLAKQLLLKAPAGTTAAGVAYGWRSGI